MTNIQTLLNSQDGPKTLIMLSGEQLQKLIDDVRSDTRRIIEEQLQLKYLTAADMMNLFGVTRSTLDEWVRKGRIRSYKMGEGRKSRIYFEQSEVRYAVRMGNLPQACKIK